MDDSTRAELIAHGMSDRRIRRAVDSGELVRLRPGHYADSSVDGRARLAVAAGGRLACLAELRHRGVWVLDSDQLHIHVPRTASRLRAGDGRVHWRALADPGHALAGHVSIVDALIQAHSCLDCYAWIASVDSALHLGAVGPSDLPLIAAAVPRRSRRLLALVDRRAESGLESIVRLIALDLGLRVRSQVRFAGVGRVDLVIEDWVVVETDGSAFHDVALSARDRGRDARLVAIGRTVLRPGYSLVVHDRAAVARQLIGAVASHRRVKDAGRIAARARRRLGSLGLS